MDEQGLTPEPREPHADPEAPDDPLQRDAEELRALIDAGAGSPEELRALAERIRAHKALEQSRWRSDVKPELLASKKWRNRRTALVEDADDDREVRRNLKVGALFLGGALLLLLVATRSGVVFVLLPVLFVLVYAYRQGRRPPTDQAETDVSSS